MKRIIILLMLLLLVIQGCVTKQDKDKLPTINPKTVKQVSIFDPETNKYRRVQDLQIIKDVIESYNKATINSDQPFETTPDRQIKVTLKNGQEYLMMDGDGPQALIVFPDGSKKVVKGSLGPLIENLQIK
jgi:uncharacterized protein YxeA